MDHKDINYERIASAIGYLQRNYRNQPRLEEVAEHVHMSPYHFQRLFSDWAGVSPKKFTQFLSVEYAKKMFSEKEATLFDVAHETGLSGTGRLHDLFVNIEGMTPGEFKDGGRKLEICFHRYPSPFGTVVIANTQKGICFIAFEDEEKMEPMKEQFPNARFKACEHPLQRGAAAVLNHTSSDPDKLKFHVKGTPFQIQVWKALLGIPEGRLASYGELAAKVGNPKSSRAVGSAIGKNPIAYLIPCHRVIQSTGLFGNYRWGSTRKAAIIGWEAARYLEFWQSRLDELEKALNQ